jgi:predicted CXXCH cytochrome family protein
VLFCSTARAEEAGPVAPVQGGKKPAPEATMEKHFPTKPLERGSAVQYYHAPYIQGNCSLCHIRDDVTKPGPLRAKNNVLCLSCHEPMRRTLAASQGKSIHKPVAKDCGFCHNAHNSTVPKFLYKPQNELCGACHKKIDTLTTAKVRHDAVTKQKGCKNCHDPHASDYPAHLLDSESAVCNRCHNTDTLKDNEGKPLSNFVKIWQDNPFHHGPAAGKNCSACHEPHGSPYHRILNAEYPDTFYVPFTTGAYALCFGCHDSKRITEQTTTTLTGFRNGDKNLHYTHVIAPEQGRSCRACHGDHAAKNPHLIRTSIPIGSSGWELPINFKAAKQGGSCNTCHPLKTYDNGGVRPTGIADAYLQKAGKAIPKDATTAESGTQKTVQILLRYASRLRKVKKRDQAVEEVIKALSLDDQSAEAHALLGNLRLDQHDCDAARESFDRALSLDEENVEAKKGSLLLEKKLKQRKCITATENRIP